MTRFPPLLPFLLALTLPLTTAGGQSEKGERSTASPGPTAAGASEVSTQVSGESSDYDARALRLESGWTGINIVRGVKGPVVGRVGLFRTRNVAGAVAGSFRAESEVRIFRADHKPGAIAGGVGAVTFLAGIVASSNSSNSAATPILIIAGAGTMVWSAGLLAWFASLYARGHFLA
jgi:hypothetical protein